MSQRRVNLVKTRACRAGLLALGLLTVGGGVRAEPACTLDRAISTTIDDKPFLTNGYGSRWNHAANREAWSLS